MVFFVLPCPCLARLPAAAAPKSRPPGFARCQTVGHLSSLAWLKVSSCLAGPSTEMPFPPSQSITISRHQGPSLHVPTAAVRLVPEETALATLAGLRSLRPTGRNPLLTLIHDACAPRTYDLGYGVLTKGQFTVTGNTLRIELKTSPRLDHTPKHMILAAGFIQNARRHRFRNRTVAQCTRQHTPVRASLFNQGPLSDHSPSKEGS